MANSDLPRRSSVRRDLCAALRAIAAACRDYPEIIPLQEPAGPSSSRTRIVMSDGLDLLVQMGLAAQSGKMRTGPGGRCPNGLNTRVANIELTEAGKAVLDSMLNLSELLRPLADQFATRPNWDSRSRELRLGNQVVKRFRRSARN